VHGGFERKKAKEFSRYSAASVAIVGRPVPDSVQIAPARVINLTLPCQASVRSVLERRCTLGGYASSIERPVVIVEMTAIVGSRVVTSGRHEYLGPL